MSILEVWLQLTYFIEDFISELCALNHKHSYWKWLACAWSIPRVTHSRKFIWCYRRAALPVFLRHYLTSLLTKFLILNIFILFVLFIYSVHSVHTVHFVHSVYFFLQFYGSVLFINKCVQKIGNNITVDQRGVKEKRIVKYWITTKDTTAINPVTFEQIEIKT